ncbi:Cysteine-type peptidase [Desmophyllum pertusum]|uniref:Cysteine-type peptidase n=1 Tax=Desmophyllum pertusum TaxID=174260 RepID=A0A9W9Z9Q6_9CNID|nr:Cysteine-type peptidase [Desmophyllum pertusum]
MTRLRIKQRNVKQKAKVKDQLDHSRIAIHTPAADVKSKANYVINLDDISSENVPIDIGVLADVLHHDDNFRYPRRMLGNTKFPNVDSTLVNFSLTTSTRNLADPIMVKRLPPLSVLEKIANKLTSASNGKPTLVAQIPSYGDFNIDGIRILQRFHRLKCLHAAVTFEIKWLKTAFLKTGDLQKEVTEALLDRWNREGTYLASYGNYRISSQELSLLCGERYLSDEIINFLGQKYCDKANEEMQECQNILLPSYLSTGNVDTVVEYICRHSDMGSVVNMFLPVHMNSCHWGLAIFSIVDQTVFFDDGYHCSIPENLKQNAEQIIQIIFKTTGNVRFQPTKWNGIRRFVVPMPDQPDNSNESADGCGSCGVAVICYIRDVCNGNTETFTWTYKDTPRLRAEMILEILGLST